MANTIYPINKGINKPIEFRGLKAQYIWWLGGLAAGGMVVFAILYICGISAYICIPLILGLGALGVSYVYRLSRRYGEFGMMKNLARKHVPKAIRVRSRKFLFVLLS